MASFLLPSCFLASFLSLLVTSSIVVQATDLDSRFYTFTALRGIFSNTSSLKTLKASKVSVHEFPALTGHSVSMTVLQIPPRGLNPLHVNVLASGLFMVLNGRVEVGLVDETNKLYTQILEAGDVFLFPKGLMHYQYNVDRHKWATTIASFSSSSAGTYSIPPTIFGSGIRDEILAKSLNTDLGTIRKIKGGIE